MKIHGIVSFIQRSIGQVIKQKLPSYAARAFFSTSPCLPQRRYSVMPSSMAPSSAIVKRTLSIGPSPDQDMLFTLVQKRDWAHLACYIQEEVPESLAYTLVMAMSFNRSIYTDLESQKKVLFSLLKNIKDVSLRKEAVQYLLQSVPYPLIPESLTILEKIQDIKWKEACSLQLAHRLLEGKGRDYLSDRDPKRNLEQLQTFLQSFTLLGQIQDLKKSTSDLETMTQRIYLYMAQPSPASLRQVCFCIGSLQSSSIRHEIMTSLLQDTKYNRYEVTSFLDFLHPFKEEDFLTRLMQIVKEQDLMHQHPFYAEFFMHVQNASFCEKVADEYLKDNPENILSLLQGLSCNEHLDSRDSIFTLKLSQYPLDLNARSAILEFWLRVDPSGKHIESILSHNEPLRQELLLHASEHMCQNLEKLNQILSMLKIEKAQDLQEVQRSLTQPRTFLLRTATETFACQRYSPTVLTVTDFLSKEECAYLCEKYDIEMQKFSAKSHLGGFKAHQADLLQFCVHSSHNKNPRDPVVDKLLNKIDTFLSVLNSSNIIETVPQNIDLDKDLEQLAITRYEKNVGKFDPHFDNETSLTDRYGVRNRIATALIYLNTVEEGGATTFVDAGVSIQPESGKLLFFYNYDPKENNPNKYHDELTSKPYKPWYPSSINRHAGRIPISNDKTIITAFFMEPFNCSVKQLGSRNSRTSLPFPIMP
jgi:hypothetical protein